MASDFIERNIEYYLPMVTKVTRRKDNNKPRKSVLPLFAGYISYCGDKTIQGELFRTGRIVNFIEIKYQKHFIKELQQIERMLGHGIPLEPLDMEFFPGQNVEVVSGPLKGTQGQIAKIHNIDKLILTVEGMGRAAMMIDSGIVKPVEV